MVSAVFHSPTQAMLDAKAEAKASSAPRAASVGAIEAAPRPPAKPGTAPFDWRELGEIGRAHV